MKCVNLSLQPDDIMRIVAEKIPPGFLVNLDTFLESLNKESSFKPHGELVHSFKTGRGVFLFLLIFLDFVTQCKCLTEVANEE